MFNDWLKIGPLTIHGYGTMIAIGILMAVWYCEKQASKHGLDPKRIEGLALVSVVTGFIFAKLLFVITVIPEFIKDPISVLGSNGWVIYGGIIGGLVGALVYCRIYKIKFTEYFNLVMPAVALAQGFGRIGCFFAGCCYGIVTDAWYGVTFPLDSLCPVGKPVIPTQLLSSAFDFGLFFVLHKAYESQKYKNNTGTLYLILYGIGRFLVEFIRGDVERGHVGMLSTSQFIGIFVVIAGIVLFVYNNRHKEAKVI